MMAQRKDMMRIIRQDAGFSAKLVFGGKAGARDTAGRAMPVPPTSMDAVTEAKPSPPAIAAAAATPSGNASEVSIRPFGLKEESRDKKKVFIAQRASDAKAAGLATGSAARGHVVHVALSLTTRQARQAEAWATAARCTVQFLIRRVAQVARSGLRRLGT